MHFKQQQQQQHSYFPLVTFLVFTCLTFQSAATSSCHDHMSVISSYWVQSGSALGNWWADIQWTYQAGHVIPMGDDFSFLDNGTANAIIELYWTLFDYTGNGCDPNPTRAQNLVQMNSSLAPYVAAGKILAFYIHDEPYANGCTISQVEDAISATKAIWPNIPTSGSPLQRCPDCMLIMRMQVHHVRTAVLRSELQQVQDAIIGARHSVEPRLDGLRLVPRLGQHFSSV